MRKILASSSFAVADTLKGMILRLQEKQALTEDVLGDLEEADDWFDQFVEVGANLDSNTPHASQRQASLEEEIALLSEYQQLAANITDNAKGKARSLF